MVISVETLETIDLQVLNLLFLPITNLLTVSRKTTSTHCKQNQWISQKLYLLIWWDRLFSTNFGGNDDFSPHFYQQLLSHGSTLVEFIDDM